MFGADDPITSLDSGGPVSAPGATDAPPAGHQAPLQEEEEMGRRGRGRGKRWREHVNKWRKYVREQESDASSAGASGTEEADDEAEESEGSRSTKKGKQDTTKNNDVEGEAPVGGEQDATKNNDVEGEAPVGGYRGRIAWNLEDSEEDYDQEPVDYDTGEEDEDDMGEDMEMDYDHLFLVPQSEIPTLLEEDAKFEDAKCRRAQLLHCQGEGPAPSCFIKVGDVDEWNTDSETDEEAGWFRQSEEEELSWVWPSKEVVGVDTYSEMDQDISSGGGGERRKEEGYEVPQDESDPPAAVAAQEGGKGGGGERRKEEGYEGPPDESDPPAAVAAQEWGKGWVDDDIDIFWRCVSMEEETVEEPIQLGPVLVKSPERICARPKSDKWKDAAGGRPLNAFYASMASRLKTFYEFAEKAERNGWPNRLKRWPCVLPKCINYRANNCKAEIRQKRWEIRRLQEIQRACEFCEGLVTRKPYIKRHDDTRALLEVLKKEEGVKCDGVSLRLIFQAIQVLKLLLYHVEYLFHPLIREGHAEFLALAIRMQFRVERHKLEEFFERTGLDCYREHYPYLGRAIEKRKRNSEEARQVQWHKEFDVYLASSDFGKEVQIRNLLLLTPESLAEFAEELKKSMFKYLDRELIEVSLKERCMLMKFRQETVAYAECLTRLLKNDEERFQFALIVNDLKKKDGRGENVLVDDKLFEMLPVIHARYFPDLPKYYAVQGILHYLEVFSSDNGNNKKKEYAELHSSAEKCMFIDELWKETRSYDEKAHKAMRQPLVGGILDPYLEVNRAGC